MRGYPNWVESKNSPSHSLYQFNSNIKNNVPVYTAAAAKSLQSCLTLCYPIDGSPPGSPIPGILQARTLEWVAISFSNAWKWKVKVKSLSRFRLLATPWTAASRLLHPWDFPGKSTGVGCHCFLRTCSCCYVASVVSDSVRPHRQKPTRLPHPWHSPGKNTGVGCQPQKYEKRLHNCHKYTTMFVKNKRRKI